MMKKHWRENIQSLRVTRLHHVLPLISMMYYFIFRYFPVDTIRTVSEMSMLTAFET